ncbi:hypothetical protein [Falsiroseomonas sp.]|uniref:hypothetical protein n=1 Tax=Falsiroseomonas sp. TaxID=2870721 RepID=UPI003F6F1846
MKQQEDVPGLSKDAAAFRAKQEKLEMTMAELVRTMISYGDNRSAEVIRRNLQRVSADTTRYPGELRAMMGRITRTKKQRMRKAEATRAATMPAWPRARPPRD